MEELNSTLGIIPLTPDYKKKDVKHITIKYEIDELSFKAQVPLFENGTAEEFLTFLIEFKDASSKIGYNTGPKRHSGFEQLLNGTSLDEWNTLKRTIQPGSVSIAAFQARIEQLKMNHIPDPSCIEVQKTYMRAIRKPRELTIAQFVDRVKYMNILLSEMPGASASSPFSEGEIKDILYQSVIKRWRSNFINSGRNIHEATLDELKVYLTQQEQQTDLYNAEKKHKNQGNRKKDSEGKFRSNSNFSKGNGKRKHHSNGSNDKSSNKKGRLNNDDPCPLHNGKHKWGQCYQNQYGSNFKPRPPPRNDRNNSSYMNNYRNNSDSNTYQSSNRSRHSNQHQESHYSSPPSQIAWPNSTPSTSNDSTQYTQQDYHSSNNSVNSRPRREHSHYHGYYYIQDKKEVVSKKANDWIPEGSVSIHKMNGIDTNFFGLCLFDSGSTSTLLNRRAIPPKVSLKKGKEQKFHTTQGSYSSSDFIVGNSIRFPEFTNSRAIPQLEFRIFDNPYSKYDMIVGRDVLHRGFIIDHKEKSVTWDKIKIPMMEVEINTPEVETHFTSTQLYKELHANEVRRITESNYESIEIEEVVEQCQHLSPNRQKQLNRLLSQFKKLFSGRLGHYRQKQFALPLIDENTEPIFCRPFSIPQVHLPVFKKELQNLIQKGVLERVERSQWAFPTFIIPKKDGRVRWVSDFRKLNRLLQRSRYFLPRISEIMQRRKGFTWVTKLDLSMGFYTFELNDQAQGLCVITTPFGLYKYKRLPMGVTVSPDIFQAVMHPMFQDEAEVECFMDDIGIFSNGTFEEHLKTVERVATKLQQEGFTVNPLKCEWGVKETEYLGFILTTEGIKPIPKKVEAIQRMERPKNTKQVRSFVGLVNYYRDMWPRRAHILNPLTQLCSSKVKYHWGQPQEEAFQSIKSLVSKDVLLRFPKHDEIFHIYTDASNYQLGAIITQNNLPVAFFSKKLTPTQRRYSTIEQEMLAIVSTLKEYRNFLLGAEIVIYTDHKNLLSDNTINNRVFRWKATIEEYGPTLMYIKGHKNVQADALSRLDNDTGQEQMLNYPREDELLHHNNEYPLSINIIHQHQQNDQQLMSKVDRDSNFFRLPLYQHEIIVFQPTPEHPTRIAIPITLEQRAIHWLHSVLGHAGQSKLAKTLSRHYWFPKMHEKISDFIQRCEYCQRYKRATVRYAQVPPKNITNIEPWEEVAVDMIGPWNISIAQIEYTFLALTCIDTTINIAEIIPVANASSLMVSNAFQNNWLSRYPRPQRCVHDNGNEFMGREFQMLLKKNGINSVNTTVKNPQANAIVERFHQSISTTIAIAAQENPPTNFHEINSMVHDKCAAAQFAYHASYHRTLDHSPGELAFGRNMLAPFARQIDWKTLRQRRQDQINSQNLRENTNRKFHDYNVGDRILILDKDLTKKLNPKVLEEGPWTITNVHVNGTVTINRNGYLETINICCIKPYFS